MGKGRAELNQSLCGTTEAHAPPAVSGFLHFWTMTDLDSTDSRGICSPPALLPTDHSHRSLPNWLYFRVFNINMHVFKLLTLQYL